MSARPWTSELATRPMIVALAPEYRRCAIYVIVGLVVILLVVRLPDRPRPHQSPTFGVGVSALLVLWAVSSLRWRLRLDDRGISRRRLFGWHLYPWEDFESGQVRESAGPSVFEVPARFPWDRELSLERLTDDDRSRVAEWVRRVWVRPAAPEPPPELTIRPSFRCQVTLAPEQITIVRRGEERRYSWSEVQELRIRRWERERRDFRHLKLVLSDQTITLELVYLNGRAIPTWWGPRGSPPPRPEIVAGLLQRHVPQDRIVITSLCEPPTSLREWEDRREVLDRKGRELNQLRWITWGLGGLLVILCLTAVRGGWLDVVRALVLGGMSWGLFFALQRKLDKDHWEAITVLESEVPKPPAPLRNRP